MQALPLILSLALPARAGVAASAEAGADASVPRISLQTELSPAPSLTPAALGGIGLQPAASLTPVPSVIPAPAAAVSASAQPVAPKGVGARIVDFLLGRKAVSPEPKPGDGPVHPLLTGESSDLGLEGLKFDGGKLRKDGVAAESLGRGMRGFVDAHPSVDGAVIKTVNMIGSANPMIAAEESTPEVLSAKEEKVARELAALGAGPRFFGKSTIDGRLVSVRERIYGKTVEKLIAERAYGPYEHALVLSLLGKLTAAGLTSTDMKAENIMIGRTAADGTRKAWLVDGGSLIPLKQGTDILDTDVPTRSQFALSSVRKYTDKGLKRYKGLAAPKNEAERLDREFSKIDLWAQVGPAAKAEIEKARAMKMDKAAFKAFVQAEADAAIERIKAARGVSNIGFHYNLHGGRREDYVGVGIRATKGDIALRYSMNADANDKVYFFQSAQHGGFVPLDSTNGEHIFVKLRMGYVMNLFDLDAPALAAARADGRIKNYGAISMDFHGMRGVPYSTYLAPPVEVFSGTAKKIGLKKLSWDEETLVTIRYLEAVALAGGPYVPR